MAKTDIDLSDVFKTIVGNYGDYHSKKVKFRPNLFSNASKKSENYLDIKTRYLQIAFDRDLDNVNEILPKLPNSHRILIEVGTPLIKTYGALAIQEMRKLTKNCLVADVKAMDRGLREVEIATSAMADAVVALGSSPLETLNFFIEACNNHGVYSMLDFMNVERPIHTLKRLREQPDVIILHRGFDEYTNKSKLLPLKEISDIRDHYPTLISVAGGVDLNDIQKAFFNGANIVVLTDTLTNPKDIPKIAKEFLDKTH